MFNLTRNLTYLMLSVQEKFLKKLLLRRLRVNKKSNTHTGEGYTLTIDASEKEQLEKAEFEIKNILLQNEGFEALADFIRKQGTKVITNKNTKYILNLIKAEPGFFIQQKGLLALYLNLNFLNKFSFTSEPMFIYEENGTERHHYIKHFYKWYMIKKGIQTPNARVEKLERDLMLNNISMDNLSYQDITDIKQAAHNDKLGVDFALRFIKEDVIKHQKIEHSEEQG